MIFGKPSFISESGALSHISDSGANQTAFRRNDNEKWDTLIVPNLLNDDLDGIFQIKANYSVSGTPTEETILKLDCSGTQNNFNVELKRNTNDKILIKNTLGNNEDSIKLLSSAGGITLEAQNDKDIILDGGQLIFTSKQNISNAISLTTDIGSNETIFLNNKKGTDPNSIKVKSDLGGILLESVGNMSNAIKLLASSTNNNQTIEIIKKLKKFPEKLKMIKVLVMNLYYYIQNKEELQLKVKMLI